MAANNRIYYPVQQVAFRKPKSGAGSGASAAREAHGVQSIGITTTFNLEQAFELGQLAIYENIEGIPSVEVTMSKVLDGYPLLWCLATSTDKLGADLTGPSLAKRAPAECGVQLGIWPETQEGVSGVPPLFVEMSGMAVNSFGYNFPLDDNFSEDITLAGNNKLWSTYNNKDALGQTCNASWATSGVSGNFQDNNDAPIGSGGVNRRENMFFADTVARAKDADYTILPADIFGVSNSGVKSGLVHVASISVSTDLAREEVFELGARSPYYKAVTFPIEVTCDIEVTSISGDLVNALDDCGNAALCATPDNLADRKIRIATCEGTRIYLGEKNKLASVSYGGGDAGGGNVTVTYSYTTFNDFTVLHSGDDFNAQGQTWWAARKNYLGATAQGTA
jgi:hypothetical protein|tara:strand:- start:4088 stop:5266 length:1179 start_codon:yes stop_codon:yes gene_type:complete